MKKLINFLKFGLKLTYGKLKAKPCITHGKTIGLVLCLTVYGLAVSFAVNIIEARGAYCTSGVTQLTCDAKFNSLNVEGNVGIGTTGPGRNSTLAVISELMAATFI